VKSGGSPPLFTKQTTKITLQTLLFTKNQSTKEVQKYLGKVSCKYAMYSFIVSFTVKN